MDLVPVKNRSLTRAQFERLAEVPPEKEWMANITNAKTRRAYKNDVFVRYPGLQSYDRSPDRTSSAGARTWNDARCRWRASGASSRPCPRCSIICASTTQRSATRSTA
jgi:hypothetical protein